MGNEGVQISQRATVTTQPTALHLCSELPEAGSSAVLGPQFLPGFSPKGSLQSYINQACEREHACETVHGRSCTL